MRKRHVVHSRPRRRQGANSCVSPLRRHCSWPYGIRMAGATGTCCATAPPQQVRPTGEFYDALLSVSRYVQLRTVTVWRELLLHDILGQAGQEATCKANRTIPVVPWVQHWYAARQWSGNGSIRSLCRGLVQPCTYPSALTPPDKTLVRLTPDKTLVSLTPVP